MSSPDTDRPQGQARREFMRNALGVAGVGAVAGSFALAWKLFDERDDKPLPQRAIQVHGGKQFADARTNTLRVWMARPRVRTRSLTAEYKDVGDTSSAQIAGVQNLLVNEPESADLLILDPEYLPGLVDAGQVAEYPDHDRDWLVNDLGCFVNVADRCLHKDKMYAVPLNTDFPLLAIDTSRVTDARALDRLADLSGVEFWKSALELVRKATGAEKSKRLLLQTGQYEGFTACLTELIAAFGSDTQLDRTLNLIKTTFPEGTFEADGAGDENAALTALQNREAVAARLWPSYCRELTGLGSGSEADAATYAFVPIPKGALGGQVIAVGKRSTLAEESLELATHLAQAASQWQLNLGGGYVPTIAELYADSQLRDVLYGVREEHIGACTLRPKHVDYQQWSNGFREDARRRLIA